MRTNVNPADQSQPQVSDSRDKFGDCIADVARHFFGPPNRALCKMHELRWGERGSFSVDTQKGVWRDHETGEGGGTLDLVKREVPSCTDNAAAAQWLEDNEFIRSDREPRPKANGKSAGKPKKEERLHTSGDRHPKLGKPATTYPYWNATGDKLLCEVARFEPKTFRPRQPDGNGGWFWDLQGLDDKLVVYRLPEITEAIAAGHPIYIFEGEKDANAAVEIGLDATCNQGGTGGWRDQYKETFRGAEQSSLPTMMTPGASLRRQSPQT